MMCGLGFGHVPVGWRSPQPRARLHHGTTPNTNEPSRSTWGRTKIGNSSVPALAVAVPVGLVAAFGLAAGIFYGGALETEPLLTIGTLGIAIAAPMIGLVYAPVVARDTIRGAVANPEESIEARWYEQAASGTFTDMLLIAGILAVVASFMDWTVELNLVLGSLILLAMVDFAVRYLVIRKRA